MLEDLTVDVCCSSMPSYAFDSKTKLSMMDDLKRDFRNITFPEMSVMKHISRLLQKTS
jgi:hypothetical protein